LLQQKKQIPITLAVGNYFSYALGLKVFYGFDPPELQKVGSVIKIILKINIPAHKYNTQ
jgi:hypothetical protein